MSTSIALQVARSSRRALCAAVALALSLACVVFAVTASTTPMAGMAGMVDAADSSPTAATTAAPETAFGSSTSSMCDGVCFTDASQMCTVAGALTVTTLLALLVASRRDTFVGLLRRTRPGALPRRRRLPTPWTVLSPISLCVLRV